MPTPPRSSQTCPDDREYRAERKEHHGEPRSLLNGATLLGPDSTLRSGTVIYRDVEAGEGFQTGHNVVVRSATRIGRHVSVGTGTVLEGRIDIGDFVKIGSLCLIPAGTRIGSRIFIAPGAVMTNDRYPLKDRDNYIESGPVIEDGVTVGAGSVITPGVTIGEGAFIAAGAVVTADVPPMTLAQGCPARHSDLDERLSERNTALSWRGKLD